MEVAFSGYTTWNAESQRSKAGKVHPSGTIITIPLFYPFLVARAF